jgi:hypothetical protein
MRGHPLDPPFDATHHFVFELSADAPPPLNKATAANAFAPVAAEQLRRPILVAPRQAALSAKTGPHGILKQALKQRSIVDEWMGHRSSKMIR